VRPVFVGIPNASLRDTDRAFDWLARAFEQRDSQISFLRMDPRVDNLRVDPRLDDLFRRMKLPQLHR
jgi:hypothetical protein